MLPQTLELPAAILLLLGGAVACFAGYRLFRTVLVIYGFIFGAMLASSVMGTSNTVGMVVAAILGGFAGALLFAFAYFVGIALVGAGLGVFLTHVAWDHWRTAEPPAAAIIIMSVAGAVAAMLLQRYVIIVSTAFCGAWTMMVGWLAVMGDKTARVAVTGNVWILYPFNPAPGQRWVPIAWVMLGSVGTAVQLGITGRKR